MSDIYLQNSLKVKSANRDYRKSNYFSLNDVILETIENNYNLNVNEYKIAYYQEISSDTGTVNIPTGSTILLNQLPAGADALVSEIDGKPTGVFPETSLAVPVDVASFDTNGNYILTGVPDTYPVAIIFWILVKAEFYSNLNVENIIEENILTLSYPELNDLTTSVTWANVPDANITQSSVTQHEAALTITESQISDLMHFTPTTLLADYSFTDNSANWNTSYSWGNHSGLYIKLDQTSPQSVINGAPNFAGGIKLSNGTAIAPAIAFTNVPGMGIYSPGSSLMYLVFGDTECWQITSGAMQSTSTYGALILRTAGSATSPSFSFGSASDMGMYRSDENKLGFSTVGVERMVIDANGFVGIGTTAPAAVLDIVRESAGAERPVVVRHYRASGSASPGFTGYSSRGTVASPSAVLTNDILAEFTGVGMTSSGTHGGYVGTFSINAAQSFTYSEQGTYMRFSVTPLNSTILAEAMRIDSAGNVGIGTTSIAANLDIHGNPTFSNPLLLLTADDGGNGKEFLKVTSALDSTASWVVGDGGGGSTFLPFFKSKTNQNTNPSLFIIGDTTAGQDSGTAPLIRLSSRINNSTVSTRPLLAISNVNTDLVTVTAAGDVGIGTTTPTAQLGVESITEQLRLRYNTVNYLSTTVGSTGTTTLALTGTSPYFVFDNPVKLKGYTVATLPTGVVGMTAYVTDALAPAYAATVVGGGTVTISVLYNGTNWICN